MPTRHEYAAAFEETVLNNPWFKHQPYVQQARFLLLPHREVLYGGAAGGGKSDASLMAAAQYNVHGQSASLVLRRTFTDLAMQGGLIERSHEWWDGTAAKWNPGQHAWQFPSGASITFGYLASVNDMFRYQGTAFHLIDFEELTQFRENDYRYLFRSLRKVHDDPVPLRMRATANPGGLGHEWVRDRFGLNNWDDTQTARTHFHHNRAFVPARLEDNEAINARDYDRSLRELDPVMYAQLRHGNWKIRPLGPLFNTEWLQRISVHDVPTQFDAAVRYWDMSAGRGDASAGVLMKYYAPKQAVYIFNVQRYLRMDPAEQESQVHLTAELDTPAVPVRIEEEAGGLQFFGLYHLLSSILEGYDAQSVRVQGSKYNRARPFATAMRNRKVYIVEHDNSYDNEWIEPFIDELRPFPTAGVADDQVDGASGAYTQIMSGRVSVTDGDVELYAGSQRRAAH